MSGERKRKKSNRFLCTGDWALHNQWLLAATTVLPLSATALVEWLCLFQFFLFKRTRKRPKPTSFRDGEAVTLQADIKEQKRRYFIIENASMVFESLKLSRSFKLLLQFRHFLSVTSPTHPPGTTTIHIDKAHERICPSNQTNGKSESPNSRLSSDDVEENEEGGKKREMKVQLSTSSF